MVEKKNQTKSKQSKTQPKPRAQKTPNNKTVKAVKETKVEKEATVSKTQKSVMNTVNKTNILKTVKKNTNKKIPTTTPEKHVTYDSELPKDTTPNIPKDAEPVLTDISPKDAEPVATPELPKAKEKFEVENDLLRILNNSGSKRKTLAEAKKAKKLYKLYGFDSLEMLDVAFKIETAYGIRFTTEDAKNLCREGFDRAVDLIQSYDKIGR